MSERTVLSEEQLRNLRLIFPSLALDEAALRAVERAVLEAVGGQYDALNRGIIADLAPVNGQPHSYARGAALEAVDTITALRAFHDRAIEILGAHGALDQGVEVDALTWLADVLTQADGLRARVAELERDVDERSREIGEVMQVNERLAKERDAAQRENAERAHLKAELSDPAGGTNRASLPPLDPALVEECARAWNDAPDTPRRAGLRAALTHYRERVEVPLREEKRQACIAAHDWEVAHDELKAEHDRWRSQYFSAADRFRDAQAEADRLRAELNQYDERGHEARNEIEGLRAELANVKAREADRCQKIAALLETPATPAPATDEERQRLAYRCRWQSGPLSTDTRERIATLLEQPAPRVEGGEK